MAYDANDPETKAAVQAAVDAALEDLRETHETEVAGLKANRDRLKEQLKKARTNPDATAEDQTAEIERLEGELRDTKGKLTKVEKDLRDSNRQRDEYKTNFETESKAADDAALDSALTSALDGVNVVPQLRDGAKAMLRGLATVKREADGKRVVVADGKPLGEFATTWAQGEQGKHYIAAPANQGGAGGAKPAQGAGGIKEYRNMTTGERTALANSDPAKFNAARTAWEQAGKPPADKAA